MNFVSDLTARTGNIPLPDVKNERFVGGHALCCVGYDDDQQHFIVLNSWGTVFGQSGYGFIPYVFIANNDLCNDCHAFLDVELQLLGEDTEPAEVIFDCLSPKNAARHCSIS